VGNHVSSEDLVQYVDNLVQEFRLTITSQNSFKRGLALIQLRNMSEGWIVGDHKDYQAINETDLVDLRKKLSEVKNLVSLVYSFGIEVHIHRTENVYSGMEFDKYIPQLYYADELYNCVLFIENMLQQEKDDCNKMFENNPDFFVDWVDILITNLKSEDFEKEPIRIHLVKIKEIIAQIKQ